MEVKACQCPCPQTCSRVHSCLQTIDFHFFSVSSSLKFLHSKHFTASLPSVKQKVATFVKRPQLYIRHVGNYPPNQEVHVLVTVEHSARTFVKCVRLKPRRHLRKMSVYRSHSVLCVHTCLACPVNRAKSWIQAAAGMYSGLNL